MKLMNEVTDEDVFLFFKRYNSQHDGMMTYPELRLSLAPLFSQLRAEDLQLTNQEASILDDDQLMSDLQSLWEAMFINLRASECLRERIRKRPKFDKQAVFAYCDRDQDGQLSVEDIKLVLIDHNGGQLAREKEILLIVNKFKGHHSRRGGALNIAGLPKDSSISRQEYIEEITPKIIEPLPDQDC
jgi:Ca2+-binding EF-hand superfamily protein